MSKRTLSLLFSVAFCLGLFGCDYGYQLGVITRPNVVFISIDSLRADRIGYAGYQRKITIALDTLASGGIYFKNAQSTSSWELPAMCSVLTGLYPKRHGAQSIRSTNDGTLKQDRLNKQLTTLPEYLKGGGYSTYAFVTNDRLTSLFGFNQGFDIYHFRENGNRNTVEAGFKELLPYLKTDVENKDPYFIWLHWSDPSYPYLPNAKKMDDFDPAWRTKVDALVGDGMIQKIKQGNLEADKDLIRLAEDLYDSEVAATDTSIGNVLKMLPDPENTIIVICAPFGESFGEHGHFLHGSSLFAENLHVPLMVVLPGQKYAGTVVDQPVSLVDILPTILATVDLPLPSTIGGQNLLPLAEGNKIDRGYIFADLKDGKNIWRTILDSNYKLIMKHDTRENFLYAISSDPGDMKNIFNEKPNEAEKLIQRLKKYANQKAVYPVDSVKEVPGIEAMDRLIRFGHINK